MGFLHDAKSFYGIMFVIRGDLKGQNVNFQVNF